jgi:hypothetical protein
MLQKPYIFDDENCCSYVNLDEKEIEILCPGSDGIEEDTEDDDEWDDDEDADEDEWSSLPSENEDSIDFSILDENVYFCRPCYGLDSVVTVDEKKTT